MTSDERREVAATLRDYSQLRNCYPFEALYVRLNIILFGDNGWDRTDGDVFERLADLIDPTCHKVIPSEIEGYVFCSKCGAEIGEYGVPNYCHNCGARVV